MTEPNRGGRPATGHDPSYSFRLPDDLRADFEQVAGGPRKAPELLRKLMRREIARARQRDQPADEERAA